MRKTKVVDITAEGRDKGKRFLITEMPAMQAEQWAARAFLALAGSGVELPDNVEKAGIAGIAILGFQALGHARYELIKPLMDEMMQCIKIIPDPERAQYVRDLNFPPPGDVNSEADIEEVNTIGFLRMEVFELHTGFSIRDVISKGLEEASQIPTANGNGNLPMSPSPSA